MATQQRKKPAGKKAANKPTAKRVGTPVSRDAFGSVMASHRADMWGIGLILVGLLSGAATWLGSAGIIGQVLDDGMALVLGVSRSVVPIALAAGGVALVRGGDPEADDDVERIARFMVGGFFVAMAVTGVLAMRVIAPVNCGMGKRSSSAYFCAGEYLFVNISIDL